MPVFNLCLWCNLDIVSLNQSLSLSIMHDLIVLRNLVRHMQTSHCGYHEICLLYCACMYTWDTKFMIIHVYNEEEEWHEIFQCHWRTRAITTLLRFLPGDLIVPTLLLADECSQDVRFVSCSPEKMQINKSVARRAICRGLHQEAIKQYRDVMSRSFQLTVVKLHKRPTVSTISTQ